jgi:putative IMPACT (imprinted ancient) family translation regulator
MCILRELQRKDAQNLLLIVTRYFGGVHLQADRYKHVIDACKIFFEQAMQK